MAHPHQRETEASQNAKLKRMTSGYGEANPKDNIKAGVDKYKTEGPEPAIGFGSDAAQPKKHGGRRNRVTSPANPYATYARGGAVKHHHKRKKDAGGSVTDDDEIEQADIQQKVSGGEPTGHKRGGRAKHRDSGGATNNTPYSSAAQQSVAAGGLSSPQDPDAPSPGNNKRGGKVRARGGHVSHKEQGLGSEIFPGPVKPGTKHATVSSEPSPTPVDNRAHGGRTKGKNKGGNHVNIMIAPQKGQTGAGGPMPVSAMPTPPPMPHPPGGPPGMPPGGMPPGGPPMGGGAPGGLPPQAMAALAAAKGAPPGAIPPGIMPPRKRGGRVHGDEAADKRLVKGMVKKSALR